MHAFLYGRVSTEDQSEAMQAREMIEMCQRRGWTFDVFSDHGMSGAKENRPELQRLLALCRRRKCDVVVVYRYDRFARSLRQLVNALDEFRALGIQFISVHEQIDTTTPHGRMFFGIFASIAEFEREIIRQRVRSGMQNAKARGARLGRPSHHLDASYIARRREERATWGEIAAELKVSPDTCQRVLKSPRSAPQKGVSKSVQ